MSWEHWHLSYWQLGATAARNREPEQCNIPGLGSHNYESWYRGYNFAFSQMVKELQNKQEPPSP
jgi:hypothetical protein